MQNLALVISALFMALLAVVFYWVSRRQPTEGFSAQGSYTWRWRVFLLALVAGVVLTWTSLSPWPHAPRWAQGGADRTVTVEARQWSWTLSETQVALNERVEFVVTSADVNHGFALYDPEQKIVAQVQAMPGFSNRVSYQFTRPGIYKILCLEYCGLAHHGMVAEIQVQ